MYKHSWQRDLWQQNCRNNLMATTALNPLTIAIKCFSLFCVVVPLIILKFLSYHVIFLLNLWWLPVPSRIKLNYWTMVHYQASFAATTARYHAFQLHGTNDLSLSIPCTSIFHISASIDASAWNALPHLVHLETSLSRSNEIDSHPDAFPESFHFPR